MLTMDIVFQFRFALRKNSLTDTRPGALQIVKVLKITIAGVPVEKLNNGVPDYDVTWQAEEAFLARVKDRFPFDDLIEWECLGPTGLPLSRFRVYLPIGGP
jgi:hypothetical protein